MNKKVALVEEIIIALLVLVIAVTSYYIFNDRRHVVYVEPLVSKIDTTVYGETPRFPPPAVVADVFASTTKSK